MNDPKLLAMLAHKIISTISNDIKRKQSYTYIFKYTLIRSKSM